MAYRFGLPRYYIVAAVSLAAGLLISLAGLDSNLGPALNFTVLAVALILAGLATLVRYLNGSKPIPAEGES